MSTKPKSIKITIRLSKPDQDKLAHLQAWLQNAGLPFPEAQYSYIFKAGLETAYAEATGGQP